MLLDEAITLGEQGTWHEVQVRPRPGSTAQWFVMLRDIHGKSFILADNEDNAISSDDMNEIAQLVRSMGQKEFTVFV
ncbi:hypothetical protein FV139_08175 [Parahaliea maris]|uniref:Uncharacterized protein n=1 Tax=Parahaliea maris TaxID=2716870 RepID=A0A5C9A4W0_9GAMM|nr:hypothetical protein [Parahaliea maris]TXS95828.1 hypothetical protein FV139_08175 [Parahaliea maris]